jgi:hypothetical protein
MESESFNSKIGKAKGFQYVLDGTSLLLADGPNSNGCKERFRFRTKILHKSIKTAQQYFAMSGFSLNDYLEIK